jgi:hypothetical protein
MEKHKNIMFFQVNLSYLAFLQALLDVDVLEFIILGHFGNGLSGGIFNVDPSHTGIRLALALAPLAGFGVSGLGFREEVG